MKRFIPLESFYNCSYVINVNFRITPNFSHLESLREKGLYLELFLSAFCSIRNTDTYYLNTDRYKVSPLIQSESGKMRARRTWNTDTFYAIGGAEKSSQTSVIDDGTFL